MGISDYPDAQKPVVSTIPVNKLKKRTMVKDCVGKVRAQTYNLPQDGFIYGMVNAWGQEGAGDGTCACFCGEGGGVG